MKALFKSIFYALIILLMFSPPVLATDIQIGSYRIPLDQAVCPENAANAVKAASIINGTIIASNGCFSFDRAVGPRTSNRGFVEGLMTVGQGYAKSLGGGICMTASILHQAVKSSGLKVLERHNHGHYTGYLPLGEDAAISRGSQDYRFQNTRNYPVKIRAYTADDALEVCLIEQRPGTTTVHFDGNNTDWTVNPLLKNNQLLVPIRPLAELIGASVTWDQNSRKIVLTGNGQSFESVINSVAALQNGKPVILTNPPQIIDGQAFLPLRTVAESLNLQVAWDGIQNQVVLSNQPAPDPSPSNTPPASPESSTSSPIDAACWTVKYTEPGKIEYSLTPLPGADKDNQYGMLIGSIETPKLIRYFQSQDEPAVNPRFGGSWTPQELGLNPGSYDCRLVIYCQDRSSFSKDIKTIEIK